MPSLLDELIAVSEQMYAAIEGGDVAAFAEGAAARARLLHDLADVAHPEAVDAEWQTKREHLLRLGAAIRDAASIHEQRLASALEGAVRVKQAQQHYQAPPRSRTILHEGLAV